MIAYLFWAGMIAAAFGAYVVFTKKDQELTKAIAESDVPSSGKPYAKEIAISAASTKPGDVDAGTWASVIAGILGRESNFGDSLKPPDPSGVGDLGNRWRSGPPQWAKDLGLVTGRSKIRTGDGVKVFEIRPPAVGGSEVRGWGYGLGQHDWEMGGVRSWIESGGYADPQQNIMKTAIHLAANYKLARTSLDEGQEPLRYAIAMYNAGAAVINDDNPDLRTTGGDYSADVLRRAESYGIPA